tara:strand:- start:364 stop:1221 length:858 start_codon:yes stop_codon:yes gene_type:complete
MKILSIDVGIKNLAYCLFELTDKDKYKIVLWDTIDLINQPIINCSHISNKNKPCPFKAKYGKKNTGFCKKHAKMHGDYIIPTNELNPVKYKRLRLAELMNLAIKYNVISEKIKIVKSELISRIDTYVKDSCFDSINKYKCKDVNLVIIGRTLMEKFDSILKNQEIDCIIIENQIAPIANRMTTIQGMISQYFIMRDAKTIEFMSSANKLKHWVKHKTTYNERKKLGIKIALELISLNYQFKEWDTVFCSSKKKDDLADSFLQGIWYIQDNNLININQEINVSTTK